MKDNKLSAYEQKVANSVSHSVNRVVYCKVCGKPIEFTDNSGNYQMEIQHQIHYHCLPAYNRALNEQNK